MEIEKEIKVLLTKEEYESLQKLFKWDEELKQTNYYYTDMEGKINKDEVTIRVREKAQKLLLQIKRPRAFKNALHISDEYEVPIDRIPEKIDKKYIQQIVGGDIGNVELIGKMITYRKVYNWGEEVEICLDRNLYINKVDYELEVEFINEIPSELVQTLNDNNIYMDNIVDGKYKRFMSELNAIR